MRITHFLHLDGPGGGPKVIRQLLQGLPSNWKQNLIHGGTGSLSAWCAAAGIASEQVPTTNPYTSLFHLGKIRNALLRHSPDIILLHGQWAGPIGALALRRGPRPPAIYVSHCPAFYHSTNLLRVVRNHIAESLPCQSCAAVVALSKGNHYNYLFRGWVAEERLHHIYNGMDPDDLPSSFDKSQIQHRHFPAPSCNAVFVGRLDEQKRVDWLIEAWDEALNFQAKADVSTWHLWIVGEGPTRKLVEHKRRCSRLPSSIHLIGAHPHGMAWIAAADLVVMSSLYEGHALVPLEAMACAKPVASFDTEGVVDSIAHGRTGLLAPLGDCKSLGQAIAMLLSDPKRSLEMGKEGRERLIKNFPLRKMLAAYTTLFERIIQEGSFPLQPAA